MKILIIEDSKTLRRSLGYGLASVGHEVDHVEDGLSGLDLALREHHDLILLDIMLPGIDGIEVLTQLRAKNATVPVLILSARDTVDDRVRGLDVGADDYLVKPFSFRELLARIDSVERRRVVSLIDQGTGVLNGSALRLKIDQAIHVSDNAPSFGRFAVLLLEFERSSSIADALGPKALDEFLGLAGERVKVCCGRETFVARATENQLGVVLENVSDLSQVYAAAGRLRSEFQVPISIRDREFYPSVSFGVVWPEDEYESADDVLRDGGAAVRRSKGLGRERCVVFHSSMRERAMHEFVLENDLRRALSAEEFFLEFQPIVHVDSGRVVELEALIRWRHPTRGVLAPSEFMMSLEESGLIVPVGKWVLREACRQLAERRGMNPAFKGVSVAVNLAARQLAPALVEVVRSALHEFGLEGRDLCLEVTETTMIEAPSRVMKILEQFRKTGIRIALDDFGTGYSSLRYLNELPFDTLKIDRSFVSAGGGGESGRRIVRSIVELARDFNLEIVAEGVEERNQLDWLRELRCDRVQGYLFSRPCSLDESDQLVGSPHETLLAS